MGKKKTIQNGKEHVDKYLFIDHKILRKFTCTVRRFQRGCQDNSMEKGQSLQHKVLEKQDIHIQNNEVGLLLSTT